MLGKKTQYFEDAPQWYKDAIIYEIHIRAFYDSNSDGIGDFKGLSQKLGYLEDLGITAIWLLPFYPSPLKDDGYDISDYLNIHPNYGTLREFEDFLKGAHKRGIRVITELVINHTSDQHAWFQRARRSPPGSVARNYYVWSDSPERFKEARIIFKDFETSNWSWDSLAKSYYWHRFYMHQPDLNFESPEVQRAVFQVVDFWLNMGVDGLRLDAVPYLFQREGTNCENLPETHKFLKKLRAHVDNKYKNRIFLAEANQWPEDAVAYFGSGDECHMTYHFSLMPRMFMALQMEDRFPIIDILDQTPAIPDSCQWALFLRNHDELTLEMVTDEERDYMYRMYARDPNARLNLGIRRRLSPLLENDRRKIELMNVLLFSMPGTPVLYYGDEIGMGDNHFLGDRDGVRTPMQWSADRNAGFSRVNPQQLYLPIIIDPEHHYEATNAEVQERNHSSLLWWVKRMVAARKQNKVLGRGNLEFLFPENPKILAFVRQHEAERVLVVMNLSRHPQVVELDLSMCIGCVPEEVFSRNRFPIIKDSPYLLTLGAYGYYLFVLREEPKEVKTGAVKATPEFYVDKGWEMILQGRLKNTLETEVLPTYIKGCRWFGGKARELQHLKIVDQIPTERHSPSAYLLFLEVYYSEGVPEMYLLPVSFASGDQARKITEEHPEGIIARIKLEGHDGIVYDGVYGEEFRQSLLGMISKRFHIRGVQGELFGYPGRAFRTITRHQALPVDESHIFKAEQSNTSMMFGTTFYLKLYRHLDEGVNPDAEIGRFLTEKLSFPNVPSFAGVIEYRKPDSEPIFAGLLQGYVANQGDAWRYTLDEMTRYFERVLSKANVTSMPPEPSISPLGIAYQEIPPLVQDLIGGVYLEMASLLGKRTAELHRALSTDGEVPAFTPEPFTTLYQRSIFQSMQSQVRKTFHLLNGNVKNLPDPMKKEALGLLAREKEIVDRFRNLLKVKITGMKIRIHGDYHLGQVLYTGNDFIIADFEGERAKPMSERRLKRSPLRDVAGMLRSFHYAAHTGLFHHGAIRQEDLAFLEPWTELWHRYVGGVFLRSYFETVGDAPFLPKNSESMDILMNAFLLNKAVYELGYELNNRPDWLLIPLRGIQSILNFREGSPLIMEIQKAYPYGIPSP